MCIQTTLIFDEIKPLSARTAWLRGCLWGPPRGNFWKNPIPGWAWPQRLTESVRPPGSHHSPGDYA